VRDLNLEDLRALLEWSTRARSILAREIVPRVGTKAPLTEYDVIDDVIAEVQTLKLAERDVTIPGITKAKDLGVVHGAVAQFKDKVKKNVMPVQFAKDDDIIVEPLYRPAIFNLPSFRATWSDVTPPAEVTLINYTLKADKELIILTDIVSLTTTPGLTELQISVDGETQRPVTARKDFLASNLRIYELPFPVVADLSLTVKGRVESASGEFSYLPIGIHVVLGVEHKKTLT
jgi:hypothetical protein